MFAPEGLVWDLVKALEELKRITKSKKIALPKMFI